MSNEPNGDIILCLTEAGADSDVVEFFRAHERSGLEELVRLRLDGTESLVEDQSTSGLGDSGLNVPKTRVHWLPRRFILRLIGSELITVYEGAVEHDSWDDLSDGALRRAVVAAIRSVAVLSESGQALYVDLRDHRRQQGKYRTVDEVRSLRNGGALDELLQAQVATIQDGEVRLRR